MISWRKNKQLLILSAVATLIFSGFLGNRAVRAANSGDVIINEIMYHASSDADNDDYIELYNTTGSTINLDNWCITAGVTLCFTASHSIASHGYAIVSRNTVATQNTYGVTPLALYAGNLSNGGETVTLRDNSSNIINEVTYSDSPPWPAAADGNGPSLELKNPTLDNSQVANWGASIGSPTPGVQNSWFASEEPTVSNVSDPNNIPANSTVTVTATVQNAQTVNLIYKVMFGTEVTVQMLDDGLHGDGGAGNGVYGAQIPGQAAGQLVRFKIEATNTEGTSTKPNTGDLINYYGYMVQDPTVTSVAPVINWFVDDDTYETLQTQETHDRHTCVVVYGNEVYDNVEVRTKGFNTRYYPKKNYKFYLPDGYKIQIAGTDRAIDEFHMNANYRNEDAAHVPTVWWAMEQVGMPVPDILQTRLQRNNEFEGSYMFGDKYEKEWREDNNYDDDQLFEGHSDSIPHMADWKTSHNLDRKDPAKREAVLDRNDLPAMINSLVTMPIIADGDHSGNHNLLFYYDESRERWSTLYWDMDLALKPFGPSIYASPYEGFTEETVDIYRFFWTRLYEEPDLRQMYYRRLRTMVDQLYANNALRDKYLELSEFYEEETTLDNQKWPEEWTRRSTEDVLAGIDRQKTTLLAHLRQPWAIPAAQTSGERAQVYIEEVNASSEDDQEYVKISNNSSSAVDVSEWSLEEINYTLPKGSVIPGGGSVYFVKSDLGYKTAHSSVIILGQYETDLGIFGGTLTLRTDTNQVVDDYDY